MQKPEKRTSLLCPDCRKLVGKSAKECPYCGLKRPGSIWNDNIFSRGSSKKQAILRVVIYANVVMFALSLLIDLRPSSFSGSPFNFLSPSSSSLLVLGSTGTVPLFQFGRWWTLISASYLHGSLMHIVFNMIALHQLGPLIIKEYGTNRFVAIYTLSGIGGYLISSFFGVRFTIGASAAVCGLIGAALYYGRSRGGVYGKAIYSQIGGWAATIFVFGFIVPGINNWGHAGGMLSGALAGVLLGYVDRGREKSVHRFVSIACVVFTVLALSFSLFSGALFILR